MTDIEARNSLFVFGLLDLEVDQWPLYKHLLIKNNGDIKKTYKALKALRSARIKIDRNKGND